MRPWLSVVIPTCNGAVFLAHALDSVAAQQDAEIEIIAVDDGSTDATLDLLRRYARRLPLTIIEQKYCGNWVLATVAGMAAARGRYLSWLHQDDVWRPRRLATLRRLIAAYPRAALLAHPTWYLDAAGRRIGYWHCPMPCARKLLSFRQVGEPLVVQCSIASCATAFSAEAVRRVGLPDPGLTYHADWEYWLRLAELSATVYHRTPLASFRLHRGSQTIARADEAGERFRQARLVQERYLRRLAGLVSDGARLSRVARFSSEANQSLNRLVAGDPVNWRNLAQCAGELGPAGAHVFLRDSRIVERCVSRLQAGVGPQRLALGMMRKAFRGCILRNGCRGVASAVGRPSKVVR